MLFQQRFPNSPSHDTQFFDIPPDPPLNEVMPENEHSSDSDTGDIMDPPPENIMEVETMPQVEDVSEHLDTIDLCQ